MPRPRVKDEDRKRVARACDTCKRRKEKCNGTQPCLLCKRRDREDSCIYSDGHQRTTVTRPSSHKSPVVKTSDSTTAAKDTEIAIESLLTLSGTRSTPKTPVRISSPAGTTSHAPVPKLARLLRDGHGKFIFVGDSSTLAFLQNIRRLAKTAIGECNLTTDPKRHAMIEAIPVGKSTDGNQPKSNVKPTKAEAQDLVQCYLLASSGIIDLFDHIDIMQHLSAWTEDKRPSNNATDSIFFLVLAIGAQNRHGGSDDDDVAEYYFGRGRDLAVSSFMDDPSVLTVQSYVLIAFYMLTACRRNGAFMLLGIAIRAAYALGLHRSDISVLFEARERQTRERVWKSLRVLDMFTSASLGRPPATSEVDGGSVAWEGTSRGYEDVRLQALHSSALLRICFIFERVLNEVYCRREVSARLVDSISHQYRDWNLGLDAGLQMDGLMEDEPKEKSELQKMVGLAHIKGLYYWSIILLTRPFLIFDVSNRVRAGDEVEAQQKILNTTTLSEACIDAALRSIEIGSDLVHTPGCPRRPFMVTNSVFVSALVVGLAILGNYDRTFPLFSSLDQAKVVLEVLAKYDPAGRRFVLITTYLRQAALDHVQSRNEKQLRERRQEIHSIFGDHFNRHAENASHIGPTAPETQATILAANFEPTVTNELADSYHIGSAVESHGPILTTSGALAASYRDLSSQAEVRASDTAASDETVSPASPGPRDIPSIPSYNEEFPFFSLMDEFDSMNDPFLDSM